MLEPTNRSLFLDAFRPPTGYDVDLAIGTTYTLNLRMLLMPPLAMAAHDREVVRPGSEPDNEQATTDSLALLEAVRRYANRMTVYCHAGGIDSPGTYQRLLTFAEDSVVQGCAPATGHIFHPKMWALRFQRGDEVMHRIIVCSRNLTEDTSWDTLLVLDEGERQQGLCGEPAARFLRALPGLSVGPVAADRPAHAEDLASTLMHAWFEIPTPFTGGEFLPLGLPGEITSAWPMPNRPTRAVVISPFLDVPTAAKLQAHTKPVLVSRPDTLESLGADALKHTLVKVLNPHAEIEREPESAPDGKRLGEVRTGLHAKVFVWDVGHTGHVLTGSANATEAAFGGNVEFSVLLTGPRASCGVGALLPDQDASRDEVTFAHILQDHTIANSQPCEDPRYLAQRAAERYHEELLRAGPRLSCQQDETGTYDVTLSFDHQPPDEPGSTRVRLLSRSRTEFLPFAEARWRGLSVTQLTPYLEIRSVVPVRDQNDIKVVSVLKTDLRGAPEDRAAEVLRGYLNSQESIVRYLRFLLDEADIGSGWDDVDLAGVGSPERAIPALPFDDLAILEPLLRAAAGNSATLDRIDALLRDLGAPSDNSQVIPEEFLSMWQVVWNTSQRAKR